MEQQEKLKTLQSILRERLPDIRRWKKVSVYSFDKCPEWIMELTDMKEGEYTVHWNGKKVKQVHSWELKTAKLDEIDSVIARNQERLKNNRGVYK